MTISPLIRNISPGLSRLFPGLLLSLLVMVSAGCASIISSATGGMAEDLSSAMMNQNDPETVREGAPAYLLMLDALIEGSPNNTDLLLAGARLYGSYASAFVTDETRAKKLAQKSQEYGYRAVCRKLEEVCAAVNKPFDGFVPTLATVTDKDVEVLYGFTAAWAGWIQINSDDYNAIAEIPKVEAAMDKVVKLNTTLDDGFPHVYLGVLDTLLPPSVGGKTQEGKAHFERAIEISEGRNLMAKVMYARSYARLVFDKELHDRLCREVLEADPDVPGLVLSNTLAQEQAEELLAGSDDYF